VKILAKAKVVVSEIDYPAAIVDIKVMANDAENDLRAAFGKRLVAARKIAGFTRQSAFARELGVTSPRLSQWESGRRMPDMLYLGKIVTITGVTLDWLYFGNPAGMAYATVQSLVESGGR